MNTSDIYALLQKIPLFSVASNGYMQTYLTADTMTQRTFSDGDIVYSSHAPDICTGIILSGRAEVHTSGGDEPALLKAIGVGDIFGIANLYATDAAFPTTVYAKEKTEVLFIEGEKFREFIENNPTLLRCYLKFLSQKIVYLNRKIAIYTAGGTEKKLAVFLLENHVNGRYHGSMTTLANLLGIGRASLYRAIDKLTENGFLTRDGSDLLLCDREALSEDAPVP